MRIAVIAPTEIPATQANTIQVMKMSQAFTLVGHEVHLIVPAMGGGGDRSWESLRRHYGLLVCPPITWIPCRRTWRKYDFGWKAVQWAKRWGAELIYTRLPQAAAFASLGQMPTILEIHDYPQGLMGQLLFRGFLMGAGKLRLVSITHALAHDLEKHFMLPDRSDFLMVAADGVDLQRFQNLPSPQEARKRLGLFKSDTKSGQTRAEPLFVAGYTGSLYAGRGIELILDLAAHLPEMHFLIVGGNPHEKERLEFIAQQRRLHNLLVHSFVPNETLPLYQATCDVLLMPYQETVAASSGGDIAPYLSPMKAFEYLACERAILSSNLPALLEVFNSQNAILLPPNDLLAWVEALELLHKDVEIRSRLAAQARKTAERYTWESRAQRILAGLEVA